MQSFRTGLEICEAVADVKNPKPEIRGIFVDCGKLYATDTRIALSVEICTEFEDDNELEDFLRSGALITSHISQKDLDGLEANAVFRNRMYIKNQSFGIYPNVERVLGVSSEHTTINMDDVSLIGGDLITSIFYIATKGIIIDTFGLGTKLKKLSKLMGDIREINYTNSSGSVRFVDCYGTVVVIMPIQIEKRK